jgi:hypothetical protein
LRFVSWFFGGVTRSCVLKNVIRKKTMTITPMTTNAIDQPCWVRARISG